MTQLLKGAPVAQAIYAEIAEALPRLRARGIAPKLCMVRVDGDEGSAAYAGSIARQCEKRGIAEESVVLPKDTGEEALLARLGAANADASLHGVLLMRPLPRGMDDARVRNAVAPGKDVDGIADASLAGVFTGGETGFAPCTAEACMALLAHYGVEIAGKRAVVIGRSLVIGRPVAMLLLRANATVTVCHTKTADIAAVAREADILIAAAGKAGMVDTAYTNPKQIIVDVGTNVDQNGNLCGDVDYSSVYGAAGALSPVPGGVGAVTTAVLLRHVVRAAENSLR